MIWLQSLRQAILTQFIEDFRPRQHGLAVAQILALLTYAAMWKNARNRCILRRENSPLCSYQQVLFFYSTSNMIIEILSSRYSL